MARTVIEFTTGQPGSGKSYRRCAWLIVDRVLNPKEPEIDKLWSNYPVMFEPQADVRRLVWIARAGLPSRGSPLPSPPSPRTGCPRRVCAGCSRNGLLLFCVGEILD